MFTGLVSDIGFVRALSPSAGGMRWTIHAPRTAAEIKPGDSVNIAGACQTVETVSGELFTGTSIQETLKATNYGDWTVGRRVNLELALRPTDRLGGHFVTGHIDTTGAVTDIRVSPAGHWVDVRFAPRFDRWVLRKGSIAIEGVSLTVMDKSPGLLTVSFIPETVARTTLADLRRGDRVNLEFDMLVKAVVPDPESSRLDEQALVRAGWK
ncbi:MAG TPA: riboflavin synthase [bacterium]|nr:riboflavin synthase [bacterium]